MDERGIIIADRDAEYRSQMAEFFTKAGYSVETTDSAIHVLCSILEKKTPVLLLGSDFDKKVSSADLIHLLKKCNRKLHVIMVSDHLPLAQARQIRQEGIFYHALKPTAGDAGEIGMAVQCAFKERQEGGTTGGREARPLPAIGHQPAAAAEPGGRTSKLPAAILCLVAVVFGISYLSLETVKKANEGNGTVIWIFLAFCALIITTQMLPLFSGRRSAGAGEEDPSKQEGVSSQPK